LEEVLRLLKEEGLQNVFKRHDQMAEATRQAMKTMGLKLLAPEAPSTAVTAVFSPEGMDAGKIVKCLRDDFNITIAGGQDHLKGKIFRIGHIGYYDPMDILNCLAAIETALNKNGFKVALGSGLAAALKVFTPA
jgi:aspartate aminotransferase-like enzyme